MRTCSDLLAKCTGEEKEQAGNGILPSWIGHEEVAHAWTNPAIARPVKEKVVLQTTAYKHAFEAWLAAKVAG
eukprot:7225001-Prorocentrum_lima.AAC.1